MIAVQFMITDGADIKELRGNFDASYTVLDALESLRAGQAEGQSQQADDRSRFPAYRHSCHHGSCGTCGAIINGVEALMCLTRLVDLAQPRPRKPGGPLTEPELDAQGCLLLRLEPIRGGSLVAGLAARPAKALSGIPEDLPYLMELAEASAGGTAELPGDPTRRPPEDGAVELALSRAGPPRRVRFEACIECGLCSSSCPVTRPFMGPAVLAALNRQLQKHPDTAQAMLDLAGAPDGAAVCERHLACSRVCPQGVYPGKHIQLLKNALKARA